MAHALTPAFQQAAIYEAARRYLLPFIRLTYPQYEPFPVHKLLTTEVQNFVKQVENRENPRLMLFCQPRLGKSEIVSRKSPPWILGNHPDWNVGIVSYGAELAEELSADARRVVMDDAFKATFGSTYEIDPGSTVALDRASKSVAFWRIAGHRGGLRAVGVGGALTGRGFDVLIIDDPIKGRKEADSKAVKDDLWKFWRGTLRTRLEPGGGVILMQTRWAVDDLAGRLLRTRSADKWRVVSIPAVCESADDPLGRQIGERLQGRFEGDELDDVREDIGEDDEDEREWNAQYQQRPLPEEGAVFRIPDDLRFEDPPANYRGPRYLFADTSFGKTQESDYSDLQVWQVEPDGALGLLDNVHRRVPFPDLKREARKLYLKYGCWGGIIEDYGSGTSLIQEFARDSRMRILPWVPDRDKRSRGFAATGVMRGKRLPGGVKRVRFPKDAYFPSGRKVADLLESMRNFTGLGDAHDDDVDTLTCALILLGTHRSQDRQKFRNQQFDFEVA